MKFFALAFLIFLCSNVKCCTCPVIEPLTSKQCNKYDVLFYGRVDSVFNDKKTNKSTVQFSVLELYKGTSESTISLNFDGTGECMMSFDKNEKWIICANYSRYNSLSVSFCSNSRKQLSDTVYDYNAINTQQTFLETLEFLRDSIKIKNTEEKIIDNSNLLHKNIQPSGNNKMLLLAVSLLFTIGLIYFTRLKK
jgi:hypothetical protein